MTSTFRVRFRRDVTVTPDGWPEAGTVPEGTEVEATDIEFVSGKRLKECLVRVILPQSGEQPGPSPCLVRLDHLTMTEGEDGVKAMFNGRLMRRMKLNDNKVEFIKRLMLSGDAAVALRSMGGFANARAGKWKPMGEPDPDPEEPSTGEATATDEGMPPGPSAGGSE